VKAAGSTLLGALLVLQAACGSLSAHAPAAQSSPTPAATKDPHMLPSDCQAGISYVALGDSTVTGVGATAPQNAYVGRLYSRLVGVYPQARLTNLGVSGAVSADVVRDQLPQALARQPQLLTLSVGPNDITGGLDVAQYEQNIDAVLRALNRDLSPLLVVNLLPDLGLAPRFTPDQKAAVSARTVAFNDAVRRKGTAWGVEIVDLYTSSQTEVPAHPEYFSADRYHPSDAGYARWADLFWQGIARHVPAVCLAGR